MIAAMDTETETAVVTTTENGGDDGGIDTGMAAGTDTDNNQLKAAAEGGWRRQWRLR